MCRHTAAGFVGKQIINRFQNRIAPFQSPAPRVRRMRVNIIIQHRTILKDLIACVLEAHAGILAQSQLAPLTQKLITHAPQLRAIGLDKEKQTVAVKKFIFIGFRLCRFDFRVGEHGGSKSGASLSTPILTPTFCALQCTAKGCEALRIMAQPAALPSVLQRIAAHR